LMYLNNIKVLWDG